MTPAWSVCGLGTAPLGSTAEGPLWFGPQDRAEAIRTVRAAVDHGITWIDTAPFYGWGRAEEIVGEALVGRRDEVRLLTKCATVRTPDGGWVEDASPAAIRADLKASLGRLRTDHVDVLQVHDPDDATPIEDTMAALQGLVDEGLVGAIGLSNHSAALMARASAIAPVAVVQHQWSLLHHEPEAAAAVDWCDSSGARFLAWSPLASGFLTDAFDLDALTDGDLRRRLPWAQQGGRLAQLRSLAADLGLSLEQLALSWVARRGHPIVGVRSQRELELLSKIQPLSEDIVLP